ncbi:hypothetical protein BRARA_D00567 [Brassica rapa]|uniref:Uncharacterized protein n=1 Tax=Brassica campestris TaxID=3711 RepID=A0A397ZI96_BRACM|nr:hypothetical protein BRARA_D00567 [Brassica rapa]
MPPAIPNYHTYYGSAMSYLSQPPAYSSTSADNEIVSDVRAIECFEFSTQMTFGGISGVNEASHGADDSTHATRKSVKWTIDKKIGGNESESLQLHEPKLEKRIGAKRVQQSGWSEQDIMSKHKNGTLSVINRVMVVSDD